MILMFSIAAKPVTTTSVQYLENDLLQKMSLSPGSELNHAPRFRKKPELRWCHRCVTGKIPKNGVHPVRFMTFSYLRIMTEVRVFYTG